MRIFFFFFWLLFFTLWSTWQSRINIRLFNTSLRSVALRQSAIVWSLPNYSLTFQLSSRVRLQNRFQKALLMLRFKIIANPESSGGSWQIFCKKRHSSFPPRLLASSRNLTNEQQSFAQTSLRPFVTERSMHCIFMAWQFACSCEFNLEIASAKPSISAWQFISMWLVHWPCLLTLIQRGVQGSTKQVGKRFKAGMLFVFPCPGITISLTCLRAWHYLALTQSLTHC